MDENDIFVLLLIGIGIIIFLFILAMPVSGLLFGIPVKLPLVGWIALAAFAVIALYLFFKHRT